MKKSVMAMACASALSGCLAIPPQGISPEMRADYVTAVASIGCVLHGESDYLPVELQAGLTREQAIVQLERCSGTQFDPRVVDALLEHLRAEAGAHVTILNAIEMPPELREPPTSYDYNVEEVRARAEESQLVRLEALIPFAVRDYCTVETTVVEGKASREVLRMADARKIDLIVMGVQGRNAVSRAVFGSNAQDVIRHARCPVLIVHPR